MEIDISKINNPTWQAESACAGYDPRIFFEKGNTRLAKSICLNICPVLDKCKEWVLIMEKTGAAVSKTGIYAGMTPNQRKKIAWCHWMPCTNDVKTRGDFCSDEHKELHTTRVRRLREGTEQQYHKNGTVTRLVGG